ncbi:MULTISPECIES: GNAT family N-acetyltransferase [unclassified Streptomyces]|uniref:GNAT family N-acetyltransferase n=1 Tax=unclassified Streptomyces TaxID=2593676 RepID=UPI0036EA738E
MEIRKGSTADIPAIVGLFDGAMEWLVSQGRTGQWGEQPWSRRPRAVAMVEEYVAKGQPWIAENDGVPVGTLTLSEGPGSYVEPAGEPERYVHLLAARHGSGAGAALLAHAVRETRRAGVPLLRVDCYAGDDGKLVAFYEANGFVRTESFIGPDGVWPGQVLARRV